MRPRTMVALNVAGTVALISVFFWLSTDHSPLMLARWVALFVSALLLPMYWSGKVEAELARLPGPLPRHLNASGKWWLALSATASAVVAALPSSGA